MSEIAISSGYGGSTHQPYVQILIHEADYVTQMAPATARAIAMNLLEAAAAAEGDGFMMHFMINRAGVNLDRAAMMLVDFRKWRDAYGQQGSDDQHPGESD